MSTTMTISKEVQDRALEEIGRLKQSRNEAMERKGTQRYVENVKLSMQFQPSCSWSNILVAAPLSISLLGSLFVASAVPVVRGVDISPPAGGFKNLMTGNSTSLQACLVQCSDKGRDSFMIAGRSMDQISQRAREAQKAVANVTALLGDPDSAIAMLADTLRQYRQVTQDCQAAAKRIEEAFGDWLGMTCELHRCLMQTSTDISEKRRANEIHLAAELTKLIGKEKVNDEAAKILDTLGYSLRTANDEFKKAAAEIPSGWELLAEELVNCFSDFVTNGVNLTLSGLINCSSTTTKISGGFSIFNGDQGSTSSGSVDHSNVPPATAVPEPTPPAVPQFSTDPAYAVVSRILPYVGIMQSLICGGEKNSVDWPTLTTHDSENTRTGLGAVVVLLKSEKDAFRPSADPPSQKLTSIFNDVATVADELTKLVGQSPALNGNQLPGPDSSEVTRWKDSVTKGYASAVGLSNEALNMTSAYSLPLVNVLNVPTAPDGEKKAALRQQIINATTTKLNSESEVMKTASTNFKKAIEKSGEVNTNITNIHIEVSSLTARNISPENTRALLLKCIEIQVQFKSQINRLVGVFDAIATLLDHTVTNQVQPFIENLRKGQSGPEPALAGFSFTDFQRQMIFNTVLTIRAFFDVFKDISSMYSKIHVESIQQGLQLANRIAAGDDGSDQNPARLIPLQAQLNNFNADAIESVKKIIGAQQTEISENLGSNATTAEGVMGSVQVRQPTQVTTAIEASAEQSKSVAAAAIAKSAPYLVKKLGDYTSAY